MVWFGRDTCDADELPADFGDRLDAALRDARPADVVLVSEIRHAAWSITAEGGGFDPSCERNTAY